MEKTRTIFSFVFFYRRFAPIRILRYPERRVRQFNGFAGTFDTGHLQYMYRYNLKAPLKIRI